MNGETPTTIPWQGGQAGVLAPPRRFPLLNLVLLVLTAITTTAASALRQREPALHALDLLRGLPFSATLITILLVHEAGHYVMCRRHGVDASLPYFLPAPPMVITGTFGAFIRIRSRFPNRRALFDIGAAGPWAGFVVAVAAMVVGLRLSTPDVTTLPAGQLVELGDSLLTSWLTRLVLHADSATLVLHPVALAGWFGLFVTSLNLLPAGQLDGGHVLYAAVGRRLRFLPAVLVAMLLWLGTHGSPVWLVWGGIMTAMLMLGPPPVERPAEPLGVGRRLGAIATLVVLVLTFVPDPIRILS